MNQPRGSPNALSNLGLDLSTRLQVKLELGKLRLGEVGD